MKSERSYKRITKNDLFKLGRLASADIKDFFKRFPWRKNKRLCIALCQGGALHYINKKNGVKDFDVWTFYEKQKGIKDYPSRRSISVDFGPSRFGANPDDRKKGYRGRRVDLLGRSIDVKKGEISIKSIQRYLNNKKTVTAKELAKKAVVLIEPYQLCGLVAWPINK